MHQAVWTDYKEYLELGKWVMNLSVTNDAAERRVKNAQKVALSSKSESKREFNIIVMNMKRAKCPDYNRDNLSKKL